MTYNTKNQNTLYAVHLLSSATSLNSGDAVPYIISTSTSGHGITVSGGVITLSKGDWLISFTAESQNTAAYTADIYIDSVIDSTFPQIKNKSSTSESNLESTAIPILSDGSTTIEIRVNSAVSISENSDCLIYGFKL
tara:strand:- start:2059 stop:2469 length:411 start_codon:yes stop_codon:yes gene_type:complete